MLPSAPTSAARTLARLARRLLWSPVRLLAVGTVLGASLVVGSSTAYAHHPEVIASADCTGTVTFVATAWAGQGTPGTAEWSASRTNPEISVAWSTTGFYGSYTALPQSPTFRFDSADSYSFSGTFVPRPDRPATFVWVRVRALAPWGNDIVSPGDHYANVAIPPACPKPGATVDCPSSLVYGQPATFTATPAGDGPFSWSWTLDGHPVGDTSSVTTALPGPDSHLAVTVTDRHHATSTTVAGCAGRYQGPTVTITCPASLRYGSPATWTAVAGHDPADPVTYQWTVDGTPVVGETGSTFTTTLSSPAHHVGVTVRDASGAAATGTETCPGTFPPPAVSLTCPPPWRYGTAATWAAAADAAPEDTLTYQWSVNGQPVQGATGPTYSSTLSAPATVAVTVTDALGATARAAAACSGRFGPPLVSVSGPPIVTLGQPTTWTASASHDPGDPVTYQWLVNGRPVGGATATTFTAALVSAADTVTVTVTDTEHQTATASAHFETVAGTTVPSTSVPPSTAPPATSPPANKPPITSPRASVSPTTQPVAGATAVLAAMTSNPDPIGAATAASPAPASGNLPFTGGSVIGTALAGAALLGAGMVLLMASRRRRPVHH